MVTLDQGTKRALAHSQMRVGDVPGEYPSVCTGPYYRVPKKKKKKKCNAHYDKTRMQRKTWERWTQGRVEFWWKEPQRTTRGFLTSGPGPGFFVFYIP